MTDKHEFYRYLQLRNYFRKEIRVDPSSEMNGVIKILIKAYKESKIKIISELHKNIIRNRHSTKYIKEKWESELNINSSDEDWQNMVKMHYTSTSSRNWREFSWKNLVRFFITPKVNSKQLSKNIPCWRDCGELNAGHAHVFWKCDKITQFWIMIHDSLQKILGYKIPMTCTVLYLCNLYEGNVQPSDRYLVKILLIAGKKAITKNGVNRTLLLRINGSRSLR